MRQVLYTGCTNKNKLVQISKKHYLDLSFQGLQKSQYIGSSNSLLKGNLIS